MVCLATGNTGLELPLDSPAVQPTTEKLCTHRQPPHKRPQESASPTRSAACIVGALHTDWARGGCNKTLTPVARPSLDWNDGLYGCLSLRVYHLWRAGPVTSLDKAKKGRRRDRNVTHSPPTLPSRCEVQPLASLAEAVDQKHFLVTKERLRSRPYTRFVRENLPAADEEGPRHRGRKVRGPTITARVLHRELSLFSPAALSQQRLKV